MSKLLKCNWMLAGVIACFATVIVGCNENQHSPEISYTALYADSAYLGFEGNLLRPLVIQQNYDTYLAAYARMSRHLKIEDNHLSWDFTSAEELKISQNIYDYVTSFWEYDNNVLKSGECHIIIRPFGYKIRPVSEESRASEQLKPMLVLKYANFLQNYLWCIDFYNGYRRFEYISDFIDFTNSDPGTPNAGCRYYYDARDKKGKRGYVSYCFINSCPSEIDSNYKCRLNEVGDPYSHHIEGNNGSIEYVRVIKNVVGGHISCATDIIYPENEKL